MIEIYHLIYYRHNGNTRQYEGILPRSGWNFKEKKIKTPIQSIKIWIPHMHLEILSAYYDRWYHIPSRKYSNRILEFTYGVDEESGISAIAIKHPRDNYNKKIGRAIVEGRIKRMKGEIEGREPYDLNEFFLVYKEE